MKRLLAAGVLILLVAAINIGSYLVTEKYCTEMSNYVTQCRNIYENGDKKAAAEKAAEFEKYFGKAELYLAIFINRGGIDDIGMSVTRLGSYAESGDDTLFLAECDLNLMLIDHLHDTEQILIY